MRLLPSFGVRLQTGATRASQIVDGLVGFGSDDNSSAGAVG